MNIYFNKRETLKISYGAAACAIIVSFVPEVGLVLAVACGLLSLYANYAVDTGKCVGVSLRLFHNSPVGIYYHAKGYRK